MALHRRLSLLTAAAILAAASPALAAPEARLVGRAVLPADSFRSGPTSGRFLGDKPVNGRQGPFTGKQPVQGFSGVIAKGDGTFWITSDNGFGFMENSADHELRVYHVRPDFAGLGQTGSGRIEVLSHFTLHDPDRHLNYPITNQFTADRKLVGTDLDLESFQRAADGTFWFGDEFGPYLIHTDATGKVLAPP
ncbi:MAG: esterase-like activity of phytase family protein, partial [Candidatus Sericytochromatia bacterium]